MNNAERAIAVAYVSDHHPQPSQVVDLVELLVATHHLVVDGVEMLDPAVHLGLYPGLAQVAQQLRRRPVDKRLPVTASRRDQALYLLVAPRVEGCEGEVLEFPLYRVDPQTVGEGSIDLQGLGR